MTTGIRGTVLDTELPAWEALFATNVTGVFLGCRALVPRMVARGSGTVVMASVAGQVLEKGRLGIGALANGVSRAALDTASEHAVSRHQFGSPLSGFQSVAFQLADMAVDHRAAKLLLEHAAGLMDTGQAAGPACSMAKLFASEASVRNISRAVQVLGGGGYIRGVPAGRLYRDARITTIYEGTGEVQRLIISRDSRVRGAARTAAGPAGRRGALRVGAAFVREARQDRTADDWQPTTGSRWLTCGRKRRSSGFRAMRHPKVSIDSGSCGHDHMGYAFNASGRALPLRGLPAHLQRPLSLSGGRTVPGGPAPRR